MSVPRPPRPIVLDDTDPSIRYSGSGWSLDQSGVNDNVGNFGPTYMHTLHGTATNGQISFDFSGTSIQILGTNPSQNISDPMVDWECFIDGSSVGKEPLFPAAENSWVFCRKENLSDTSHSFVMNVQVKSSAYTFYFDQLRYTPSADVPTENSTILVDSSDPAIQYDSLWNPLGSTNATNKAGATLRFNFTGTSVSWYGYTPTELSHARSAAVYSIDDGGERQFIVPGLPDDAKTSVYNRQLFTAGGLRQGQHSLRVTSLGSSDSTPLTLDWLLVKSEASPSESLESPVPTGLPGSHESGHNVNVGAIVGGVVGGLVALFIATAAIFWMCRRRRKAHLQESESQPEADTMTFAVTPTFRSIVPSASGIVDNKSPNFNYFSVASPAPGPAEDFSNDGTVTMTEWTQPTSSITSATSSSSNIDFRTVQHQDSGLRIQDIDIPPHYTPT